MSILDSGYCRRTLTSFHITPFLIPIHAQYMIQHIDTRTDYTCSSSHGSFPTQIMWFTFAIPTLHSKAQQKCYFRPIINRIRSLIIILNISTLCMVLCQTKSNARKDWQAFLKNHFNLLRACVQHTLYFSHTFLLYIPNVILFNI